MDTKNGDSTTGEWSELGAKLKTVREYLGLSQSYVSERTGIPRSAVSDIERGVRKVDSLELKKLAGLYRRPVAYFLDESPDASAGNHSIAALARKLTALPDVDRLAVERFADYLRQADARPEEPE